MITIIPEDGTISIDGVGAIAEASDKRVSLLFNDDVRAIQFNPATGKGHIEYKRDIYDPLPKPNEMIDGTEVDWVKVRELHHDIIQKAEARWESIVEAHKRESD